MGENLSYSLDIHTLRLLMTLGVAYFSSKSRLGRVARWHIFKPKKTDLGKLLEGLANEDVGILYVHLAYLMAIWHSLWPFGICCAYLLYFSPFRYVAPRTIWQP
jgi:hypothetical protein